MSFHGRLGVNSLQDLSRGNGSRLEVAARVAVRPGDSARETFATELAPLGLRPNHYGALVLLKNHEPTSQQTLADGLRVDRSIMATGSAQRTAAREPP